MTSAEAAAKFEDVYRTMSEAAQRDGRDGFRLLLYQVGDNAGYIAVADGAEVTPDAKFVCLACKGQEYYVLINARYQVLGVDVHAPFALEEAQAALNAARLRKARAHELHN